MHSTRRWLLARLHPLPPFLSSALLCNATPNPIWRLGPSVDFFRRSSALDSGAAVAARRRARGRDMKMGLGLDLLMQRGGRGGWGDGK